MTSITPTDLIPRLTVILGQCQPRPLYWIPQTAKFVAGPKSDYSGIVPRVYLPGQARLVNEQVTLLRIVYSECNTPRAKQSFIEALTAKLSAKTGAVIAHVFADIHWIKHTQGDVAALAELWSGWRQRLECASELFTEIDLSDLAESSRQVWSVFPRKDEGGRHVIEIADLKFRRLHDQFIGVGPLISLIRYERLKAQLTEHDNPEINTDKQALLSRAEELGFPPELTPVLEQIDLKLAAANSPFDYKDCLGHIRTVFEKVFEHSAKAVSKISGNALSAHAQGGKFNETKGFLVSQGLFSEKEANAVQALYTFVSADGAHAFGSAPEKARVAKNCVIEWSMLLVGRVQGFVARKTT